MFLHFRYEKRIDLLAVLVAATFVDLEPLYYMSVGESIDHRIWHSIPMSLTVYPILITLGIYMIERLFGGRLWLAYGIFRLRPDCVKYPLSGIYICSLIGGFSHVFFDMFTHESMPYVIYPLADGNPFYLGPASIIVEAAVVLLVIYSCLLWTMRVCAYSSSQVRKKPIRLPKDEEFKKYTEEMIYDPRITEIDGVYYICFAAHSSYRVGIGMIKTEDFEKYDSCGFISEPDNRNGVLFPEKIGGLYARLDRPILPDDRGDLWINYSPDLIFWGKSKCVFKRGAHGHWYRKKNRRRRGSHQDQERLA